MTTASSTIEQTLVESLKPYKKNSRKHSQQQLESIAAAIEEFGFTNPILIDERQNVIAGHGRLEAAKKLKLETVPTITLSHLTEDQKKAYVIADNKLGDMSTWNDANLLSELASLSEYSKSLDESLKGFFEEKSFNPYRIEQVSIELLKPHPKNYRHHPQQQIEHLAASIKEFGFYRNIIACSDYTILAGHGITQAAIFSGIKFVPVLKLGLNAFDVKALKLLAVDNEVDHLGDSNMRQLSEVLKEILSDDDLLGTGYDESKLENLLLVSRSKAEVENFSPESEWGDLLDFDKTKQNPKLVVNFESETDRQDFANALGITLTEKQKAMWWPIKERQKSSHLQYEAG
jgi:ParB-like chromosome segregation protein Spo0J